LRLLYNCNTRYEWLVRPYSPGTSTLEEAPSFAWRPNGPAQQQRRNSFSIMHHFCLHLAARVPAA
jgi:hypothetical protein